LTGWDIDILTPDEYNLGIERLTNCVKTVEGAGDTIVDKLIALGIISLGDVDDVGVEPMVNELKINAEIAGKLVEAASKEIVRLEAESKQKDVEKQLSRQAKVSDNKA
jgi:N utilization substance protein A